MSGPEDAVHAARERAAAMRAAGEYPPLPAEAPGASTAAAPDRLLEWALIEPDPGELRSVRRLGAAVTTIRQLLLRLLGSYHASLLGLQTRFNFHSAVRIRRLEQRLAELERQLAASNGDPARDPSAPPGS